MKVVILAAGKGNRLGGRFLPKPLTQLFNGKSILELQLDTIAAVMPLSDVLIVVGYHEEQIISRFPALHYIHNPDYSRENTSKSLYKALQTIDEDVVWMNGDVVFHPTVFQLIAGVTRNTMVVNNSQVGEEEVKYRTNGRGRILEVSKEVKTPEGEALGINFFQREDLEALRKKLEKCRPGDYFEKGIEMCIEEECGVWALPVDPSHCAEVDFPEDLDRANQLISHWG